MACLASQTADVQLIAYEGFDYKVGNLNMVGGHDNGGGFGWATEVDPTDNWGPERLQTAIDGGNPLSGVDYGWYYIGWIGSIANPANAGNSVVEVPATESW